MGPLPDTETFGLRMRRECREHTRGGGGNVQGIPDAGVIHDFTYLARMPWWHNGNITVWRNWFNNPHPSLGAIARSYRRQDGADAAARFKTFLPVRASLRPPISLKFATE